MKSVDRYMEENISRYASLDGMEAQGSGRRNNRQRIVAADPDEFGEVYGLMEKDEDLKWRG